MRVVLAAFAFLLLLGCEGNNKLPEVQAFPQVQTDDAVSSPLPEHGLSPIPVAADIPQGAATPSVPDSLSEEGMKPLPESTDIGDSLPTTQRLCDDPYFGKGGLEACIKFDGPYLSRFGNITFLFSVGRTAGRVAEAIYKDSVERNFSIKDGNGKSVEGYFIWKDARTLLFDPKEQLASNGRYTVSIKSEANDRNRPRSNHGRILFPFTYTLQTQAAFLMKHSLNGEAMPDDRGLMLLSAQLPELRLRTEITDFSEIAHLSLRRLGNRDAVSLCNGSCPRSVMETSLTSPALAPQAGLNSYEYIVRGNDGKELKRHLSFAWGDIATQAEAPIAGGVYAALDRENGLKTLSSLVGNFAAGRFTIDYREQDIIPRQTFNDIIRSRLENYQQAVPGNCDPEAAVDFEYLQNLGPFCELRVSGKTPILKGFPGSVHYKAVTDIYVSDMQVIQEEGNVEARMIPNRDNLEMRLGAKKFRGKLKIVLRIDEARIGGLIPVPGATGYFVYETTFVLDGPMRETIAKANVSIEQGRLKLKLNGLEQFDMASAVQGSPESSVYFDTRSWTQHVKVSAVTPLDEAQGPWAKLVNYVVTQAVNEQVDNFKPQIVNGIARDILQVVAPNTLNALIEQLRIGLQIFLPNHLPAPLDKAKIQVSGQLGEKVDFAVLEHNSYLMAPLQMSLKTLLSNPLARPIQPKGAAGYIRTKNAQMAPSPLSVVPQIEGSGSLLAVSMDLANQTLHDIWKKGLLNLAIDSSFIDKVETFAVLDPMNENNGREIFLAEFLPKLLGSDISRMRGIGDDGLPITMDKGDKIFIVLDPRLPPFLKVRQQAPTEDNKSGMHFALDLSDVRMKIQGEHAGRRYTIAQLRAAVSGDSRLGFVPYKNPMRRPEFSGLGALSVELEKDPAGLDFMIEALEGPGVNSFAIDTNRLRETISDMVDKLFIPLLNDALREVPLTGLRACGVELDAGRMEFMPLRPTQEDLPYLVLRAPLKTYSFSGHCDLMPDLTSPLPPLPPEPIPDNNDGDAPNLPPRDPSEPQTPDQKVVLDMDFSGLPWKLNDHAKVPELSEECKSQIFYDVSCPMAWVVYEKENGRDKKDERGRLIYAYTHIMLATLVPKDSYAVRGPAPSIEAQFYDFGRWPEYAQGAEDSVVFRDSMSMSEVETQYGVFKRHYVDFETNSPKASGFIPLREVAFHRILEKPFTGAEASTEFFINTSRRVDVPAGKRPLEGAEGLDFHVGNTHILDCGKLSWCGDTSQWLLIYDAKLRPEDKSIPEDVLPYLKSALNAIIAGMFPMGS